MREFLRRITWLATRRRAERELIEEMNAHREELQASGQLPAAMGSTIRHLEATRQIWGWTWIDRLFQDLRYALRVLRKSPSFTITALLVLALGIGVNLSAFRLLLIEITPTERDPDTLVELTRWFPNGSGNTIAWPVLDFYRQHSRSFRAVIAAHEDSIAFGEAAALRDPETVRVNFVTPPFFVEQAPPLVSGRALTALDEAADAEPAAVVSRRFWEHRLGSAPDIIGRSLRLNGRLVSVVGILNDPKGRHEDFWMPLARQPFLIDGSTLLTDWNTPSITGTARLNPGLTIHAAEEESGVIAAALRRSHPEAVANRERLGMSPFSSNRLHPQEIAAAAVAIALVMLILVVACANLGSLLLARGVGRDREIRTRLALGAGRFRIVRQLLTESTVLALAGSVIAWLASAVALQVFLTQNGEPRNWVLAFDCRIMTVTVAIALFSAIAFGLAPALRLTGSAPRAGRARSVFLACQVGASCVLLIVSGQLVRSFAELAVLNPGFDYRTTLTVSPGLHAHGYNDTSAEHYFADLRLRLSEMPGVQGASVTWLPVWGNVSSGFIDKGQKIAINRVDTAFFTTLGLRLTRGRMFNPVERDVVIVSDSFARWHWPGEDPLGKRLTNISPATIIGVVASAGTFDVDDSAALAAYYPVLPQDYRDASIVIRTSRDPSRLASSLTALAAIPDPKLRPSYTLLTTVYDNAVAQSRRLVSILSALGLLATLLAAVGLAGLTGYSVGQRTREIGIRTALGAARPGIVRAVLSPLISPVVCGIVLGIFGAAAVSSVLRHNLSALRPSDPLAYITAVIAFVIIIGLAVCIPARRALRIRPADALRHD